jgi:hypothetical protein
MQTGPPPAGKRKEKGGQANLVFSQFTTEALAATLTVGLDKAGEALARQCFDDLQVVMGDRTRAAEGQKGVKKPTAPRVSSLAGGGAEGDSMGWDAAGNLANTLGRLGVSKPELRNELYAQVLQQLLGNPRCVLGGGCRISSVGLTD